MEVALKMKRYLFVYPAILCLAAAGLLIPLPAQENEAQGPPQFTTIPIQNRMREVTLKNGHVIFVPPVAREGIKEAPPPGKGGGGGGGKGGGKDNGVEDFGQPGAVPVPAVCFANSANNFDATCAQDSYQGEPMLTADPIGNKLIGSENDIYPGGCSASAAPGDFGDCGLSATVSTNGTSWQRFKLSRNWGGVDFLLGFDPSATVDSQGRYFVASGVSDGSAGGANGIVVVSSADGGATWTKTNAVVINGGGQFEDKYWIAADANLASSFADRLYVAWDRNKGNNQILLVSFSSDQGKTWSKPEQINDGRSKFERVIYAFPAVAPDGTVHVLWHDYALTTIFIDKSTDGGSTWGNDVAVASTNIGFGVDIGCNGGRSMTPAPQMAINSSGDIFIVFASDSIAGPGLDLDVFLTKSTDGGATWSAPLRVSSTSTGHQYNPAIAIDSLGEINVNYLDRRDDTGNCRTHTYLSQSTDGGATFADARVTDVDSLFDGNPNGPGDYSGIACLGNTCYPYFSDHRDLNAAVDGDPATLDGGFEIYSAVEP